MIGNAKGVKVKTFDDYTDGCAVSKLNKFIEENPDINILEIKYFNGYSVVDNNDMSYGRENAMIIYRESLPTHGCFFKDIEENGLLGKSGEIQLEKVIDDIMKNNQKLIDKYKK
ncbi:hypothetical protein PQE70_gp093 [Bacillus phage vB_BanS_Nate]|uniref:Uncharacterized protein n=1 Tax=Bacillus phage vB_BanS_Nate TaxID=2894788 RepID=A0AAE8YUU2_9CAUD|nr:hypothetical protein PQE70_gp093 [Bacillus phage vB_BanS_Nate]UGO50946.1 hypothetical protein NATE_93 [Bacillus phage vB_BanS_Nate]